MAIRWVRLGRLQTLAKRVVFGNVNDGTSQHSTDSMVWYLYQIEDKQKSCFLQFSSESIIKKTNLTVFYEEKKVKIV